MKTLIDVLRNDSGHWVGDGFPVRSLFSYHGDTEAICPFLLFDHAGPYAFRPNDGPPRGVGQHPHRGFETVTVVYEGAVSHKDSTGGGGTIGAGDVQWMTAGSGIIHEEFHSKAFSETGGPFHMVQLWVNLPAKDKGARPSYQAIRGEDIPVQELEGGKLRVIAGAFDGLEGPAHTFSPVNLWDVRLRAGADQVLRLPAGHTSLVAVLTGRVTVAGRSVDASEIARLTREGEEVSLQADEEATVLVLTGEPLNEPVVGYGPFVMTSEAEIRAAIDDFNAGRFHQTAIG